MLVSSMATHSMDGEGARRDDGGLAAVLVLAGQAARLVDLRRPVDVGVVDRDARVRREGLRRCRRRRSSSCPRAWGRARRRRRARRPSRRGLLSSASAFGACRSLTRTVTPAGVAAWSARRRSRRRGGRPRRPRRRQVAATAEPLGRVAADRPSGAEAAPAAAAEPAAGEEARRTRTCGDDPEAELTRMTVTPCLSSDEGSDHHEAISRTPSTRRSISRGRVEDVRARAHGARRASRARGGRGCSGSRPRRTRRTCRRARARRSPASSPGASTTKVASAMRCSAGTSAARTRTPGISREARRRGSAPCATSCVADGVHADGAHPADRRAEADRRLDGGRARPRSGRGRRAG